MPLDQISPDEIARRQAQHREDARGALAPETERALAKTSAAWSRWAAQRDIDPIPAYADQVAAYVDWMVETPSDETGEVRKISSIRQAVWGIAYMHRAADLPDPTKAEKVRLRLKAASNTLGTRAKQAAPIGENEVQRILATTGKGVTDLRDLALVLTMRDLLARRSEVVALLVEDIEADKDGSATALIRRSKTDQAGRGETRWLSHRTFGALQSWLAAGGITGGALFRSINKGGRVLGPLGAADVPRILKKIAARAGVDASRISGHSCRVGMAQDLVSAGASQPAVMQAGRWKSPMMPARYAEKLESKRGAVAQFYGRRGGDDA
ncbi:tyrosine-type recombinase/integrase [Roseomonas haemaphysalidis]|uniref:Site-specific integrase n=1 Tax=Roseomonas haemaphysalidis TaxID=2768162 RepID=A0ABS3KWJ4_9PROT|nr:site-specific integrase [Roseomonas haemaphysalidis]